MMVVSKAGRNYRLAVEGLVRAKALRPLVGKVGVVIELCPPDYRRRDIDNYLYLYIVSGGADNPRQIQLRRKPSTGEWFVWVFEGLLMDIRIPVSEDKWA